MHFGIFMEFGSRPSLSEAESFREGFRLVDAAEELGLDGVWLAELHFNPVRSVLSSPIVVASSIATRTQRLRIGMAVHVLPLNNPLRIAEEVATVDQISEGRFEFGVGRSGFARSYDLYGIPYVESRERFREALNIILEAWKGEPFSYEGEFYAFAGAQVSPRPYQQPHPPLRIAATTGETFPRLGREGHPIFVGLRGMDIPELRGHLKEYRKAWRDAGHNGDGNVSLRIPVYAADTEEAALEEPQDSINAYFNRMGSLLRDAATNRAAADAGLRQGRADRLATMSYEEMLQTKVAFGTGESLIDRFSELQEELGLDGVVAELNAGGLIPEEAVARSLRIMTQQVMPSFK
jgi:alkanesulfonate monooxygenase SsuD/methylene tetrahydromethanopterin reductase-like flavin-dependent oxidoreductase (luciferase family)